MAERFFAALLILIYLPMLAGLALIVHLTAGRPVFVADEWVKDGRRLRAYRFRTTGLGQPEFRSVGRYIRQGSLDDIPSLWNVTCGELRLRDILRLKHH